MKINSIFLPHRSTTTQLISTLENWYDGIYQNKDIDCLYVDFRKAFDVIPHKLLLYKAHKIGIRGKILNWIADFLKDRTFQVHIDNSSSSKYKITSGVPQGSILGPILFLIYVNELPEIIPKDICIKMYADDVKLYNI